MLDRIINWIKSNKLLTLVLIILAFWAFKGTTTNLLSSSINSKNNFDSSGMYAESSRSSGVSSKMMVNDMVGSITPSAAPTPQINVANRKVITNSNVSILVKNVRDTVKSVESKVAESNGYVVEKYINTPEGIETGSIAVRIPTEKLNTFLDDVRGLSVRVVNENISSSDITDSFMDIETRLKTLEENKARFEEIMRKAVNVEEILNVQQRVFDVQSQIESLKGQLKYMDASSKTSLLSISLSTDELSLPYTPEKPWKIDAIFKEATRSVISTYRSIIGMLIWLGVYALVWVPALGIFIGVKMYLKRKNFTKSV